MGAQWKARHKEVAANARGKIFGKLAKEIMVAAKGGADIGSNSRLRLVVEQAKKASMPKDTLDRAIKKGAGLLDGPLHMFVRILTLIDKQHRETTYEHVSEDSLVCEEVRCDATMTSR